MIVFFVVVIITRTKSPKIFGFSSYLLEIHLILKKKGGGQITLVIQLSITLGSTQNRRQSQQ